MPHYDVGKHQVYKGRGARLYTCPIICAAHIRSLSPIVLQERVRVP